MPRGGCQPGAAVVMGSCRARRAIPVGGNAIDGDGELGVNLHYGRPGRRIGVRGRTWYLRMLLSWTIGGVIVDARGLGTEPGFSTRWEASGLRST